MHESRRRAYLGAMGIDLWLPRSGASPQALPMVATAVAPSAPVPAEAFPRSPPVPAAAAVAAAVTPGAPYPEASPVRAAPAAHGSAPPPIPEEPPFPDAEYDWEPVSESAWEPVFEPDWESASPAPASVPAPEPPLAPAPAAAPLDWDALAAAVAGCRACELAKTRTKTVFGVGNRQAQLLVIGEAPGADEDRAGEPFVGRAGQLLDRMLAAIGLTRETVYIANILKCRPPNNRNPLPAEVACCQGYLRRQIELIRPRLILSVGAVSAQNLLGTDTPVGKLRGRWFAYGPEAVPLRVTYHPAYLLRSPEQKARAWDDLIAVARRLGGNGSTGLN
jgi:uracil-DNA glycosylase